MDHGRAERPADFGPVKAESMGADHRAPNRNTPVRSIAESRLPVC
jgi:hypothetical protein